MCSLGGCQIPGRETEAVTASDNVKREDRLRECIVVLSYWITCGSHALPEAVPLLIPRFPILGAKMVSSRIPSILLAILPLWMVCGTQVERSTYLTCIGILPRFGLSLSVEDEVFSGERTWRMCIPRDFWPSLSMARLGALMMESHAHFEIGQVVEPPMTAKIRKGRQSANKFNRLQHPGGPASGSVEIAYPHNSRCRNCDPSSRHTFLIYIRA